MNFNSKILILLVEDNPGEARLAKEALLDGGEDVNIIVVQDGVQALDFIFKRNQFVDAPFPDLILLDINLPKKNGIEVLKEIKSHEEYRKTPVVMLTNSNSDNDVSKSYQLHANCYVCKPMDFNQFIEVIKSVKDFWLSTVLRPN